MEQTGTKVAASGRIVEAIGKKCAALVAAEVTITTTEGGGSSSSFTFTETYQKILPARILTHGTFTARHYFSYAVGEKVALIDGGETEGTLFSDSEWDTYARKYDNFLPHLCYIAGSYYDEEDYDRLPAKYPEITMVHFGAGYIKYNAEDNELHIYFPTGVVTINGQEIYLN